MRGVLGVLVLAAAASAEGDLVDRLRSADWAVFAAAHDEIRSLPASEAVRLAPQLLDLDPPSVRMETVQLLGRLGAAAAPAVPALLAAAFDEDAAVRREAGVALASIGPAAWQALSLLPEFDPDSARALVRGTGVADGPVTDAWAAEEWRRLGRSLGESTAAAALEVAFRHPHPYVRHRASAELVRRGAAAFPSLDRVAGDPSARVRRRAAGALAALFRVEGAIPLLAARLRDQDAEVRSAALLGLGAAGAATALEEYAERADAATLVQTCNALEQAHPGASHPLLRRVLRGKEPYQRMMAAQQISRTCSGARSLLPDVIDALFDEFASVRDAARDSLLLVGGTPDEVAPWLREVPGAKLEGVLAASKAELPRRVADGATREELAAALAGEDAIAAGQAAAALGAREPKDAATAGLLVAALRHERYYVRAKAATALGSYGDLGVAALAGALADEDARVRWRAIEALGSMGLAARSAVPALVAQLDAPPPWPAFGALEMIGPGAAAALPALIAFLEAADDVKANGAMMVVAAIGAEAKPALPLLIEALDRKERSHPATIALRAFGRDAEPAVPKLRRLIEQSSSMWPDSAAFETLLRIGGEGHRAAVDVLIARPAMTRQARNLIQHWKVGSTELAETLLELSRSADKGISARARDALSWIYPSADIRTPLLVAVMEADSWGNEERAKALAERATVAELVAALPGTKEWGRWGIVVALGLKGPEARDAAPAVARCFEPVERPEVRAAAIRALVAIGAPLATARLLDALRASPPTQVTGAVERALGEIGDLPALTAALRDESPHVRGAAVRALGRIDPLSADAVSALVENFASDVCYVKGVEKLLVARKAQALPLLAALLRVDDKQVRARAVALLGDMGPVAVAVVVEELKTSDPLVRVAAVDVLRRLGEAGRSEAKRILREDPHPAVRKTALDVLLEQPIDVEAARLAFDDPELCSAAVDSVVRSNDRTLRVELLLEALGNVKSRRAALRVFDRSALRPRSATTRAAVGEALPGLRRAATERTGETQAGAALGLARAGEFHVVGLGAALRSEDVGTRLEACQRLAMAGAEAAAAGDELVAALDGGEEQTCRGALAALGAIGPAARAQLSPLRERAGAARALAPHYAVAIARIEGDMTGLVAILEDGTNRWAVWEALRECGPAGARELGQLVVLAEGEVREEAGSQLAEARDSAVPVAIELLRHEKKDVRIEAARVLGATGRRSRDAVAALIVALDDPEADVRARTIRALGSIGPAAEPALPKLEALREDEALRQAADEAIGSIRR